MAGSVRTRLELSATFVEVVPEHCPAEGNLPDSDPQRQACRCWRYSDLWGERWCPYCRGLCDAAGPQYRLPYPKKKVATLRGSGQPAARGYALCELARRETVPAGA